MLSWGKCKVTLSPIEGTGATASEHVFDDIVEDSTSLETTQGDKQEATIEGGEIEAVRYKANSYELAFQVRLKSDQIEPPIDGDEGVVAGEWTATITPEATGAPMCTINRAAVNVQVSFSASEGFIATYTVSSLRPKDASGKQITLAAYNAGT